MAVTVNGRHGHAPPLSLKGFATEKVLRLSKYLPAITAIDVEMYGEGHHKDNNGYVVEVTVLAGGPVFRTKATSGDPRACIDIAVHQLCRQLTEFTQKRSGRQIANASAHKADWATEQDLAWAADPSDTSRQPMIATRAR